MKLKLVDMSLNLFYSAGTPSIHCLWLLSCNLFVEDTGSLLLKLLPTVWLCSFNSPCFL